MTYPGQVVEMETRKYVRTCFWSTVYKTQIQNQKFLTIYHEKSDVRSSWSDLLACGPP